MPNAVSPADLTRARVADRVRGQLMQTALKEMLDQVRGARQALQRLDEVLTDLQRTLAARA